MSIAGEVPAVAGRRGLVPLAAVLTGLALLAGPQAAQALGPSPTDPAAVAVGPTPTPSPTTPQPDAEAPALGSASRTSSETVDAHRVVLHGTGLDDVAAVRVGTRTVPLVGRRSPTRLVVVVPEAAGFQPATARVALVRRSTRAVVRTGVAYTWTATSFRAKEMRWARTHLRTRSYTWGAGYIVKYDCANFVSHALVVAGEAGSVSDVSSTRLRLKLLAEGWTERADTQRNRRLVRVSDVIQFDWDPVRGRVDRDHTGLVSGVRTDAQGRTVITYIAHTDGGNDPTAGETIEHTRFKAHHSLDGRAYFLSRP